jgi:peptidoglycan/xylan/chitin deacetylase (PgdA/CDA1 family)
MKKIRGVPVVMYHAIGPQKPGWMWNYLVMPTRVFEGQMRMLRENGWTTITLSALHDHMAKGAPLPDKPLVLTFDDGYLDNWVFAYPILKKYGHRAVIWMTTDFVDPRAMVRPTLEDVWNGTTAMEDLPVAGFLSWTEMKIMTASATIEIQSHAKTHTWYFAGPEIVDFHRPRGVDGYVPYPWLGWNRHPERKYEYQTARLEDDVPYGTPVYRHEKSLAARRYFEDESLTERIVEHVAQNGGPAFFDHGGWKERLLAIAKAFGPRHDRMETNEEYEERARVEITESRRIIEKELGTKVDFICWPGGGRNAVTFRIAEEEGYLATTTHYQNRERRNTYGQNPREINRTGCGSPWKWRGLTIHTIDSGFFHAILREFNGSKSATWLMRLYKLKYILRHYLFGID